MCYVEKLEVSSKPASFDSSEYVEVKNERIRFLVEPAITERTNALNIIVDSSGVLRFEGIKLVDLRPI